MSGRIKELIDRIIDERCCGNEVALHLTRAKLMMKGIHPDRYTRSSPDDPAILGELERVAVEMGLR